MLAKRKRNETIPISCFHSHNLNIAGAKVGERFQFERLGFFNVDKDTVLGGSHMVFNRTITLKDSYNEKAAADAPATK